MNLNVIINCGWWNVNCCAVVYVYVFNGALEFLAFLDLVEGWCEFEVMNVIDVRWYIVVCSWELRGGVSACSYALFTILNSHKCYVYWLTVTTITTLSMYHFCNSNFIHCTSTIMMTNMTMYCDYKYLLLLRTSSTITSTVTVSLRVRRITTTSTVITSGNYDNKYYDYMSTIIIYFW